MLDVTDHALLRFLERAHGLDVEAMRAELAARLDRAATAAAKIGPARFHICVDGLRFVVGDNRVITTIVNDDPMYQRRRGISRE